jgi:succinoglycan biosynthesis transport protein ExoP
LTPPPAEHDLTIRDYLQPIWARRYLVLAVVIVVTVGTYAFDAGKPKRYAASTDIYLRSQSSTDPLTGAALPPTTARDLANEARLLRSLSVAQRVAKDIKYAGDPKGLLSAVSVLPSPDADFVTVTADASTAQSAADLANAFAKAFIDQRDSNERGSLASAVKAAQRQLGSVPSGLRSSPAATELELRVRQLRLLQSLPQSGAAQLEEAQLPSQPFAPDPPRSALFAFVLSLLCSSLAAYALERLNSRIRRVDSVGDLYGAPVLSVVPHSNEPLTLGGANSVTPVEIMETFRTLRSAIELSPAGADSHVLLVTSAVAGEGKSTVARCLAIAYRETGRSVLLVEADLRRPSLASTLRIDQTPGLTDVLTHKADILDSVQTVSVGLPGIDALAATSANGSDPSEEPQVLRVLTGGAHTPNPSTLLASPRFGQLVAGMREQYDTVIIDSAPLVPVADTLSLLPCADGIVIVSRVGISTAASALRMMALLERYSHTALLGVVANDAPAQEYGYPLYASHTA